MFGRRALLRQGLGLLAAGAAAGLTSRAASADLGSNLGDGIDSACPPSYEDLCQAPTAPASEPTTPAPQPAPPAPVWPQPLPPPPIANTPPWIQILGEPEPPAAEAQASTATGPRSFLDDRTLITVYGRSFGVAPVLGMLGQVESFDDLEEAARPWTQTVALPNAPHPVTLAPPLLYALARGCREPGDACLIMLDSSGVDIIGEYIEPALERDMAVVLDVQMGRSSVSYLIRRMIDRGYLAYPNVHVALDPEFATRPNQTMPGHPIGYLSADQINEAQDLLATYVRDENLPFKKMLMVHQFADDQTNTWTMISNKQAIEVFDEVDLVIDADGFGTPDAKVLKYNGMTDPSAYPWLNWRAIKIFQRNPIAPRFSDTPVMTPRQIFGLDPTPGGRLMWAGPHVLVLA